MKNELKSLGVLWGTQALSGLGSAMTNFALVIWSYEQEGSALSTALLTICSYAPYVLMSIFAGAFSDRWNRKRTLLVCDVFAALCTLSVLILLKSGLLRLGHLYILNALNGLMNTIQQPTSEVAVNLLTPKRLIQRMSGLRALANSMTSLLTPAFATATLAFGGMDAVIAFDLLTCAVAVISLAFFVQIPQDERTGNRSGSVMESVQSGLRWLAGHGKILGLILLLAAINLIASMYNAALPAMLLSREGGGTAVLGWVNTCTGIATVIGGLLGSLMPEPKDRVRVIHGCLLFSMSTENLLLALGRSAPVWCFAAILGWLAIPIMNTNLNALFRDEIPIDMQGRVYSARNTLQFFTIPLGYLLGGALIDRVLEPYMVTLTAVHPLVRLLGEGKGSGAALLFLMISGMGVAVCLIAMYMEKRRRKANKT